MLEERIGDLFDQINHYEGSKDEVVVTHPIVRDMTQNVLDEKLHFNENAKIPEESFGHEKLTMSFWINQIRKIHKEVPPNIKNKYEVELSPEKIDQIIKEYNNTLKFENNVKKIKTFFRKVYQKILDLLFD